MQGVKDLAPDLAQSSVAAMLLGGPMGVAIERAIDKAVPEDFKKSVEELSTIKDDDVRLANKIALMVALSAAAATSVVLTGGTSAPAVVALVGIGISTATQVAAATGGLEAAFGKKAAVYVALSGAITGAALTLGGSAWGLIGGVEAAASLGTMADTAKTVTTGVLGAKSIAEGIKTTKDGLRALEAADYQYEADMDNAAAEDQRNTLKRIEKVIDGIIEDIRDAKESAQRATEILQGTLQTQSQTMLQAGSLKV
jgi:hypothetical protein